MRLLNLLGVIAGATLFALACGDNNSPTAPVQPVNTTPSPAATPTRGSQPTPTPLPVGGATRMVSVGPGNVFVDALSVNSVSTIKAGDTVQWNFADSIPHSTTSGACCTASGMWDSGVKSSGSFSFKFSQAGTYPYFCTVHGTMMTGTVIVN
jgi:plastocyanin